MKKYTANYACTDPNFVIQNLSGRIIESEWLPMIYVAKNLLQRGCPTSPSRYLHEQLGDLSQDGRAHLLSPCGTQRWNATIKGDEQGDRNPARYFYEKIVAEELGDYAFVQSLLVPEMNINEITGVHNEAFVQQQVDFYLPQALLVIEIDGAQHRMPAQRMQDTKRVNYLSRYGIQTVRITTDALRSGTYRRELQVVLARLREGRFAEPLAQYKIAAEKVRDNAFSEVERTCKLLPTAIMRMQLLLLELLQNGGLTMDKTWCLNLRLTAQELALLDGDRFVRLAVEDVRRWLGNLHQLKEKNVTLWPEVQVAVSDIAHYQAQSGAVNIDFSLFKRYDDEAEEAPNIIFVRGDYYDWDACRKLRGLDKNHFRVSTAPSVNYDITIGDTPVLEFFLQNIFGKEHFRDGQLSIIANALNLRDTIGLLPTGGGKSLCYQLPCLLQPAINFVVCPIKSLMYDQRENLARPDVAITNVQLICGDMKAEEREAALRDYGRGKYLFVWISPERFQIPSFRDSIRDIVANFNIAYAVVDEVHCLSEWGHDFRTSYLNLAKSIDRLSPKDAHGEGTVKYIGLTATASVNVLKDIKIEFSRGQQQMDEDNIKSLLNYSRKELHFEVMDVEKDSMEFEQEEDKQLEWNAKDKALLKIFRQEKIPQDRSKATLIFTPYVNGEKGCYELYQKLEKEYPNQVMWYAGQSPKQQDIQLFDDAVLNRKKLEAQQKFKANECQVMCATKAFGMGIDKDNICYTFHYGIPGSVEALYQEAGRAGRWDKSKSENNGRMAQCYVLYSSEGKEEQQAANRIFSSGTSVRQMHDEMDSVSRNGKDIFTHLFLFMNGLQDVADEHAELMNLVGDFYEEGVTKDIFYKDFEDGLSVVDFEKALYRLCLLGVVEDWTRDFVNRFTVTFGTTEERHLLASLQAYIGKYNPDEDVAANVAAAGDATCATYLHKAAWYLLEWIFDHITETRKQSLKTVSDLCATFKDSADFKQRIDSYFVVTEVTFVLQHIAEHTEDYAKWFEPFYNNKKIITRVEFSKLRDRLSRFLESYGQSAGLNFVSGIVRLCLNDYDDPDGRVRMVNALAAVKKFDAARQADFIQRLTRLAKDARLTDKQRHALGTTLVEVMPAQRMQLAEQMGLPSLTASEIEDNIKKIKRLNIKLYEQFGRIQ